ncbi:MAG: carbohydrate porin, partial [Cyanobacteria bacterium J06573_2]
ETFYNLQVSDNISFTPAISLVINPDNDSNQDTIWQTTLRSTFSF